MSRLLSNWLQADEPEFSLGIRRLEAVCGNPGIDIRLQTEVSAGIRELTGNFGLDVSDTRGLELYHAIINKVRAMEGPLDGTIILPSELATCWALKNTYLKKILKNSPPINTMKKLGYRSVDSMLKREDLAVALGLASTLETKAWITSFANTCGRALRTDYEHRPIRLVQSELGIDNRSASCVVEYGAVVVWVKHADVRSLAEAESAINQLRVQSTRFIAQPSKQINVADIDIPWRVVHKLFARQSLPELFQPLLNDDDFRLIDLTSRIWPWPKYLGGDVSANLLDVVRCCFEHREYEDRITDQYREELMDELLIRYLSESSLFGQLTAQLDDRR